MANLETLHCVGHFTPGIFQKFVIGNADATIQICITEFVRIFCTEIVVGDIMVVNFIAVCELPETDICPEGKKSKDGNEYKKWNSDAPVYPGWNKQKKQTGKTRKTEQNDLYDKTIIFHIETHLKRKIILMVIILFFFTLCYMNCQTPQIRETQKVKTDFSDRIMSRCMNGLSWWYSEYRKRMGAHSFMLFLHEYSFTIRHMVFRPATL